MSQLRQGTVSLTNASTTVRGNYVVTLSPHTGSFSIAETVTWSGGGSGVVVDYSGVTFTLTFYRTAGGAPVVGTALTGGTSGATGTVSAFAATSVPRFDTQLAGGGPLQWEVPTVGALYAVVAAAFDSLTLGAAYAGVTDPNVNYAIWRDFSLNRAYILPSPGDVDLAGALSRVISQIDLDIAGPARSNITLASGWAAAAGSFGSTAQYRKLASGEVILYGATSRASGSAPQAVFTLGTGFRSVGRRSWVVRSGISGTGILELAPATGVFTLLSGTGLTDGIVLDGISYYADA